MTLISTVCGILGAGLLFVGAGLLWRWSRLDSQDKAIIVACIALGAGAIGFAFG